MARPSAGDAAPGPQVLHRAIAILTAVGESADQLTLTSISARTGLPLSTAYRLSQALVHGGLLERSADGDHYRVGAGMVALAAPALHRLNVQALAPHLHSLAGDIDITANLGVPEDDEVVTVCSARPVHRFCGNQLPGARQALSGSAMGMAMLAFDRGVNNSAMEQVRRLGYAESTGPQGAHVRAIAVPVFGGDGRVWGSVGVQALRRRLTDDVVRDILPVMRRHARHIGSRRNLSSP
ncbi:IclR family transcriptional regulator [Mycobacterium sp. C31M]